MARDGPRFDHGVALPLTPLLLIIEFQGIERPHQRTTVTVRAKPHIDAENKTLLCHPIEQSNSYLPKPGEVCLVIQALPPTTSRTRLRVGENQIDVRGKIQLLAAELAHGQYDQRLNLIRLTAIRVTIFWQ